MLDDQRDAAFNTLLERVNRAEGRLQIIERRLAELEAKGTGPLGPLKFPGPVNDV